ncbi:unnamed protein product [Ectocarpus sp. 4 AP-2014]
MGAHSERGLTIICCCHEFLLLPHAPAHVRPTHSLPPTSRTTWDSLRTCRPWMFPVPFERRRLKLLKYHPLIRHIFLLLIPRSFAIIFPSVPAGAERRGAAVRIVVFL